MIEADYMVAAEMADELREAKKRISELEAVRDELYEEIDGL
jgi:two-component sensor histidine kinase